MPFRSDAQRRYLYAKHPDIAKRWENKYDTPADLPERVGKRLKKFRGKLKNRKD